MSETKQCLDCLRIRPMEAFFKTRAGVGRSDRCRECIEMRAETYRAEQQAKRQREDAELEAFLSTPANTGKPVPGHLRSALERWNRSPLLNRRAPKLSNRPQMTCCAGCGEAVPKRDLWEYRRGRRARYCKPCMKRRAVERECEDCEETKLTSEFFEALDGVSPYCRACREKRQREKHCPRCGITKPLNEFNQSAGRPAGWCKKCSIEAQRARRAAARSETG